MDSGSTPDTSTKPPAALAQLVEQLICNQQVVSSTLTGGSNGENYDNRRIIVDIDWD